MSATDTQPALGVRRLERFALIEDAPVTRRELPIAGLLLVVVTACVYSAIVIHGGLYADDWALGALWRFPVLGHFTDFENVQAGRPVLGAYWFLNFTIIGLHAPVQHIVGLILGLLASILFYAVLRTLGVMRLLAWLLAALALLFPMSDATKLWINVSPGMLSVAFCCSGLLLMIHAFRASGRQALLLHAASICFYALSIMTYETAALVIAISAPLLMGHQAPRRTLVWRSTVDVIVVAAILGFVTSGTGKVIHSGLGSMFTHGKAIASQGLLVFSQSLFPFYSVAEKRATLVVSLAIVGAGAWVYRALPSTSPDRALLGHALVLTFVGFYVAVAGWAILLPADMAYVPAAGGDATRINGAAAFGNVMIVVGLLLTCGVIVFRGFRGSVKLAGVSAAAVTVMIGLGYAYRVHEDVGKWDTANTIRTQLLAAVHKSLPKLQRGSHLYVTGYTEEPYHYIGSFYFPWDLTAAVQLTYDDGSLTAYPIETVADLHCGPTELTPWVGPPQIAQPPALYGPSVYFISDQPRLVKVIANRRDCLADGGTAS